MSELSSFVSDYTRKVSALLCCLREWQALEYTGHFIDAHPEMKERIDATARKTDEILEAWSASIKSDEATVTPKGLWKSIAEELGTPIVSLEGKLSNLA